MKRGRGLLFGGAAIVLVFSASASALGADANQEAPAATKCYSATAYVMSGRFVRAKVANPATAKFPPYKTAGVNIRELGPCQYAIDSYVEVQGESGQILRHYYTAIMKGDLNGDVWRAENLIIE
ncbi:hypothetical protein M1D68_15870 [Pseudomonas sp. R4-84]